MSKIAIVTGGRRGIGRGICLSLAQAGYDILAVDLEEDDDARQLMSDIAAAGRRGKFVRADISDLSTHRSIVEAGRALGATPSVLVNNAGVSSLVRGDLLELSPESFDRCIGVNLRGSFFLSQCFARALCEEESDRFRCIVNITSANAEIVSVNRADYCMSKAALSMATKLLAARLAGCGINVYEIRPGMIRTEMTAKAAGQYEDFMKSGGVPIARWGEPGDVGKAVAMLAQGGLDYSTGNALPVDGGLLMYRV